MKFWSQLGERELDLAVRVKGEHLEVEVAPGAPDAGGADANGGATAPPTTLRADVAPLPDGEVYSLLIDGRVHEVAVEEEAGAIVVTLHGQRHRVLVRHPLEKTLRQVRHVAPAASGETIESPIPGLVVAIKVKVGDRVLAGQTVAGTDGQLCVIRNNDAANSLTLNNANAGSAAANRFSYPANLVLPPRATTYAIYRTTPALWYLN